MSRAACHDTAADEARARAQRTVDAAKARRDVLASLSQPATARDLRETLTAEYVSPGAVDMALVDLFREGLADFAQSAEDIAAGCDRTWYRTPLGDRAARDA